MRPLLFKNLFFAFLTGLLVIAGVVYAMYITGPSDGGQLFKFSAPNTLPIYSSKSEGYLPFYTSSASFNESDLDVVVSTSFSKMSLKNAHKVSNTSTSTSTINNYFDNQLQNRREFNISNDISSILRKTNTINGSYQEPVRSGESLRKLVDLSNSNITVSKINSGSSIRRTISLPASGNLAMSEIPSSFSASDLTGGPVQQFILPGTGGNPNAEDAVPVPGGIIVLIIFAIFKFLTYDDNFKKIFTYFSRK